MIVPEVLQGDHVSIEGHDFELRGGHPDLVWRTEYLWQSEDRAVVGEVLLFAGLHAWTADTPAPRDRHAWAETLAEMERLAPRFVVAGHRSADSATDASVIGRALPEPHLRLAAVAVIVDAVLGWALPSPWGRYSRTPQCCHLGLWLTGVFPGRRRCASPLLAGFVVGNGRLARLVRGPAADRPCRG
ncbi:hypothetical protein ACWGDT_01945 [Streptomyces avermitilis]